MKKTKLVAFGVGALLFANISSATVFNLLPYQFSGPGSAVATLETNALGVYEGRDAIAALLNSSTYSMQMYSNNSLLASMDNTTASWAFLNGNTSVGSVPRLTVGETEMVLSFYTPQEFTEEHLMLQTLVDSRPLQLQYSQVNNISNSNFAGANYDAVHRASAVSPYESSFVFTVLAPTASVPEPATLGLFGFGVMSIFFARRRSLALQSRRMNGDMGL
jgi:hypothetical protein